MPAHSVGGGGVEAIVAEEPPGGIGGEDLTVKDCQILLLHKATLG